MTSASPAAPPGGAPPPADEPPADGRAARAQRRREETRAAILAASRQVFRTRGYHHSSIADIVKATDVARGTFYLYFENKQDVLHELLQAFLADIRVQVLRISTEPSALAPILQVRANFSRILACIEAHEDVATIFFGSEATLDGDSRDSIDAFWAQVEGMVEDALSVGQTLGLVRKSDRATTAVAALGAVRAVLARMLRSRASDDPGSFGTPDQLVDELIFFVLRGILAGTDHSAK
ncbi:MAG: TetR/AcrR family transcriptional regulator [bacterium]|nr:TetR/AcrR family transcriptional regulator [bacterium]